MRNFIWVLIAVSMMIAAGCNNPASGEVKAVPGKQFVLKLGQTAVIEGEQLKIKFADLLGDSRCPANAVCIWEGEASCLLEITYGGAVNQKTIVKPGSSPEFAVTDFKDYEIQFDVQPYPEAGKETREEDYYLKMVVNKKPKLTGGILVTWDVNGETYKTFITNQKTIEEVLAVQRGQSQARIPSGVLVKGTGYNSPWSWHTDPEDIHMAEVTIELCDGTPSQVEENLEYWLNTVKRFCPWSARIVRIEDFR